MRTNTYLAERYFSMLKPLDNDTKLQIVTLLVKSISTKNDIVDEKKKSLFDLYGVWKGNPEADLIEKTIREGRKDTHTRNIAAFE